MSLRIREEEASNRQHRSLQARYDQELFARSKSNGRRKMLQKIYLEEEEYKNTEIILEVRVVNAMNIDPQSLDKLVIQPGKQDRRGYKVLLWIEPEDVLETPLATPLMGYNPKWNRLYQIPIDASKIHSGSTVLKLEVIRFGPLSEVGTSTGKRVVGRAKIALPKTFSVAIKHHIPLVMMVESESKAGGFLRVDMLLRRTRRRRMFI